MEPLRVGIVGCGRISDIYIRTLAEYAAVDVAACASLDLSESRAKAAAHGIPKACTPEALFEDNTIDAVLNLTIPAAHAEISRRALRSGKHVYAEKPMCSTLADGLSLLELARQQGLKIGNAPDTFLGVRWQTVRQVIDRGLIGRPIGAFAFVGTHGTERHHPHPDFYYQHGGGPLLDLGPYYLTAMINSLGPVSRVSGLANKGFERRQIENGPRSGEWMPVEIDTHVHALLEFEQGATGSMTMSFDVWDSETPRLEIYGEEGTLCIPDPDPVHGANIFDGEVWFRTRDTARWTHQPRPAHREQWQLAQAAFGLTKDSRGIGLVDLAHAIHENRQPRASGELAVHVLEVMTGILDSARDHRHVEIRSRCERPAPLTASFPRC